MITSLVAPPRILVITSTGTFRKLLFFWYVIRKIDNTYFGMVFFFFLLVFRAGFLFIFILIPCCFDSLQLDNKKLEALPKSRDRSPVMQVSTFHLLHR